MTAVPHLMPHHQQPLSNTSQTLLKCNGGSYHVQHPNHSPHYCMALWAARSDPTARKPSWSFKTVPTHIPLGQTKPKRPRDETQEASTSQPGTFAGHAPLPAPPAPVLACSRAPSCRSLPTEAGVPWVEPSQGRDITVLLRHGPHVTVTSRSHGSPRRSVPILLHR